MRDNKSQITIALVVGETSGDILGVGLIRALKDCISNIRFVGIPGPLMKKEGCESWYEMDELSVMGIIEIYGKLRRLLYIRSDLRRRLISLRPNVFIGIDSPDFNIDLECSLKKQGIKTIHYVSPSIWAWRKKRILKIKKSTHLVLLLFPFEKKIYEKFNVPYRFIGHTMADSIPLDPDKNLARDIFGIPYNAFCMALLPGSRINEVKMLTFDFLKTVQILRQNYPNLEVIVPIVNKRLLEQFKKIQSNIFPNLRLRLLHGKSREAMIASDIALLASGTATLECMLAKCPMVVGYRIKPISYWILKHLVNTNYVSLPNLLAEHEIVKELLQEKCNFKELSEELLILLENFKITKKMREIFRELHKKIQCNADKQAANAVLELI